MGVVVSSGDVCPCSLFGFPRPQDTNMLLLVMCRYASAARAWVGATGGGYGRGYRWVLQEGGGGSATSHASVSVRDPSRSAAACGPGFGAVLACALTRVGAVEQCDDDEGMAKALEMDAMVRRCRDGGEMRGGELRACGHAHPAAPCG
jgi:hypothetical protein|eukprot:COSAG01_NODE_5654_length_4115_cov_4.459412_6_plen_148_part_00